MNEWPDGWFRDGSGKDQAAPGTESADATVQVPRDPGAGVTGPAFTAGAGRPAGAGGARSGAAWPAQPPVRSNEPGGQGRMTGSGAAGPGSAGPGAARPGAAGLGSAGGGEHGGEFGGEFGGGEAGGGRPWLRPRRILAIVAVVVALILIATVGTYFYLDSQLVRKNVLVDYAGRPAVSAGQNWLITGSDSRQGLTATQEAKLATGHDISGHRSDTILILHIPSNGGRSVLISLPRDSYLPIPGYGDNKINAAYSLGGAKLLARTVQDATGLYLNHYMGIGFGGFVNVVDAVGGVRMCLPGPMVDPKAGLDLKAGCQTLDGAQALGYVRTRNFNISDLQREQDQRLFLKALLSKMTSLGTIINPFAAIPAASGAAGSLTVDQGTSLYQLVKVAFALRDPETTTVPLSDVNFATPAGDAVLWNHQEATQLFTALRTDQPVPASLLSGSKATGTG